MEEELWIDEKRIKDESNQDEIIPLEDDDECIRVISWDLTFIGSPLSKSEINNIHKQGKRLLREYGYDNMQKSSLISRRPILFATAFAHVVAVCNLYPAWRNHIGDIRILISVDQSQITQLV
jgi:virulence-associated protein VapD